MNPDWHAKPKPSADDHAAHHPAASAPATPSQMQENMKSMQALMAKIKETKDPAERQKLMRQHMASMRGQMDMMHGMGEGRMGTKGGGSMKGDAGSTPKDHGIDGKEGGRMSPGMMMGHEMMEQRMRMMESMLDQMLQHQEAQENSRAPR